MNYTKHLFFCLCAGLFSVQAGAYDIAFMHSVTIDSAAQQKPVGTTLDSWQELITTSMNCNTNVIPDTYRFSNIGYTTTGVTLTDGGKTYPVFKTYIDGIGVALAIREKGTSTWYPVTADQTKISLSNPGSNTSFDIKGIYVKTQKTVVPTNVIQEISLVKTECLFYSSSAGMPAELSVRSYGAKQKAETCNVTNKTQSVDLGSHELMAVRKLKVGENFGHARAGLTVKCDAGMNVYFTLGDHLHSGNINTDTLFLENHNTNPGFGVQIFEPEKSEPYMLGGDKKTGSAHQYPFYKTSNNNAETITKYLDFKYVKLSDDVKATEGNAQATMTLIYK
ncbi:fimbrial protein [Morganella morganii]|uniref:fimbrial protein n=1 Tax=Morganella morganii TaxID=582 RepID=UPI001BD93806|nr:fimbrial protein [Morganella morganii]ELT0454541.1 hypothetical protein [Morganella morganii]MBT0337157.1 hypothetical protein [Morganella morganii subsp. morganii]